MAAKPLRTAAVLYLALGAAGGLLLSGYVLWIEFYDAMALGKPNAAFCTPAPGTGGDIPIAGSADSCRIVPEYVLLTLLYPPAIVIFWTSLSAALLAAVTALWRVLGRASGFAADAAGAQVDVPPGRLAMGVYAISVSGLGAAGQISGGWYLLGPFALASWPALLAPLPLFLAARYLQRRRRRAAAN